MQPIDYMTQVQQPFQAALRGYQAGAAIRDDEMQQQALAAQALLRQQQQQAALAMQQEVAAVTANPNATARDYAALTMKYPGLREQAKQAWDMVGKDRQAGVQDMLTRAYAAADSGRPDIAQKILTERAQAMRNAGDEKGAAAHEQWAELIGQNPQQARSQLGVFLAGIGDPEKFAESFAKIGGETRAAAEAPATLREKEAKATTAEVGARYADPTARADLAKKQSDAEKAAVAAKFAESQAVADLKLNQAQIAKMAADTEIARMNSRIAAMNAQTSKEGNQLKLKELQLKVEEAVQKRDTAVREKVAQAESGGAAIDNMLNTIERIKNNGSLDSILGVVAGRLPAMTGEAADAEMLIETLGSQSFLAQIPNIKGMGALSNAEGDKLQNALQNFKRVQTPKQFRANLEEAARLLLKGRKNIEASTGVSLGKPDTPAKPTAPAGNVTVSGW